MVATALRDHGRLDFAHNNAGVAGANLPIGELPETEWDRVMSVMLRGVYLCMKYEIAPMLAAGRGAIVNTASGAGLVGYANQSAYVASKHGVLGLTKSGALEYGARGIRINAVCPGTVWSPMVDKAVAAQPELQSQLEGMHPIGRLGTAAEIAAAVVWLCSDDASFVLGHALSVDGGYVVP
jgi:NAD(P)-dependent dehydrogenase (short-subunit alcohol dehydrogenase family)